MNTWIITLIGIISLCLKTILKTRQHCHGGANLGYEIKSNIFQRKPESVLFSGVRLSLEKCEKISAERQPRVPSIEKCEKNGAERQPSGAPALGPLQVWNEILMLRLSCQISCVCCFDVFHCINWSKMNYFDCLGMLWVWLGEYGSVVCELWRNFVEMCFGWYPDAPITIKAHIKYNRLCREE